MLQPGASTVSRRSSTSSLSVPFITPPSSPRQPAAAVTPSSAHSSFASRIPKPSSHAAPSAYPSSLRSDRSKARSLSASAGSASAKLSPHAALLRPTPSFSDEDAPEMIASPTTSNGAGTPRRDRDLGFPSSTGQHALSRTRSADGSIMPSVASPKRRAGPSAIPRRQTSSTSLASPEVTNSGNVKRVQTSSRDPTKTLNVNTASRIPTLSPTTSPSTASPTPAINVLDSSPTRLRSPLSDKAAANRRRADSRGTHSASTSRSPSRSPSRPGSSSNNVSSGDQRTPRVNGVSIRGRKALSASSRASSIASRSPSPSKSSNGKASASPASSLRASRASPSSRSTIHISPTHLLATTASSRHPQSASSKVNRRWSFQPTSPMGSSSSRINSPATSGTSSRSLSPVKRSAPVTPPPASPRNALEILQATPTAAQSRPIVQSPESFTQRTPLPPSNIPRLSSTSRPDRKSPGLTIEPPPPPAPRSHNLTRSNAKRASTLRPAPPAVPAKSPLRQLGAPPAGSQAPAPGARRRSVAVPPAIPPELVAPVPQAPVASAPGVGAEIPRPQTPFSSGDEGGRQTPTLVAASFSPSYDAPPLPSTLDMSGGYTPAMLTSRSAPPDTSDISTHLDTPTSAEANSFPSAFSPDSAPPSAPPGSQNNWVVGAQEKSDSPLEMHIDMPARPFSQLEDSAPIGTTTPEQAIRPGLGSADSEVSQLSIPWHDKALPAVPPNASPLRSPRTPTTMLQQPMRPTDGPSPTTMRSPSMPTLPGHQGRPRGATESSPTVPRSHAAMVNAGLTPIPQPRPQSLMLPSLPSTPSTTGTPLSRRAHLIREIATTERAHATDLALICDAYIPRESPLFGHQSRPDSQHSSNTQNSSTDIHSAASTPGLVDTRPGHVRSNSSYGMPVEELKGSMSSDRRMSGNESGSWPAAWNGLKSPTRKPGSSPHPNGSLDALVSPAAASISSAGSSAIFPSPRFPTPISTTSSTFRGGRALAPADIKAVFLNLTQLAQLSDELATELEKAIGNLEEESFGGEGGSDILGEVFCQMLPRLRPLYMYYCSRHSAATARLVELQADPTYTAYLNECWSKVKAHTHAWNLDSMLIKPVQRIMKYPLLFEDLLASTTPVHPDYFKIRNAAEGARALALDIDEAKRRKDVITSVMTGKAPSTTSLIKDIKGAPGGRGLLALRRFKKDKSGSGASSTGGSGSDSSGPPEITPYAQAQLKDLVLRLEAADRHVRTLGKEMLEWVASSRAVVKSEIDMNLHFLKFFTLDGKLSKDRRTLKVIAYKALLEDILAKSWGDMNSEVRDSVMLMLGKLLDAAKNPTMIIDKLNKKASDYARYLAHKNAAKKSSLPDRALVQEAADYVAIHTQLLEELPAFLEGYNRIIEIAVAAFTMAQARYFATFRDRISTFNSQYLSVPTELAAHGDNLDEVLVDLSNSRGIHKAWLNAYREPNNAMRNLDCINGDGLSRLGSTRTALAATAGHKQNGSSRPSSRAGHARQGSLHHTPSVASSQRSQTDDSLLSSSTRRRSSSFTAIQDAARLSPNENRGGLASLIRRNSKNSSSTNLSSLTGSLNRSMTNLNILHPLNRSRSRSRSTMSTTSVETKERLSFGLPRLPMNDQPLFDNSLAKAVPVYYAEADGDMPNDMQFTALGLGPEMQLPGHQILLEAPRIDSISESWRNSPVLYTCAAVADFNPMELGNHKFQGLFFLPLMAGDLVDVYHEIGRVADLYDFPYSQVGVENDGAVVCRAENGAIGVAMCSFLEPLRS